MQIATIAIRSSTNAGTHTRLIFPDLACATGELFTVLSSVMI
jgi:hypothetical protein